jgi:hypothetical protein
LGNENQLKGLKILSGTNIKKEFDLIKRFSKLNCYINQKVGK